MPAVAGVYADRTPTGVTLRIPASMPDCEDPARRFPAASTVTDVDVSVAWRLPQEETPAFSLYMEVLLNGIDPTTTTLTAMLSLGTSGAKRVICVDVAFRRVAGEALKKTEFSATTEEKFVPWITTVSIPATALPDGEIFVIVGCGRYTALGSYRLLSSGFVQLLSNKSPSAARTRKDVVRAKGSIGLPAF
jgi:hypothetical protein